MNFTIPTTNLTFLDNATNFVMNNGYCNYEGVKLVTDAAIASVYTQATIIMILFIGTVIYNLGLMYLVKLNKMSLETFYKRWQHAGMIQTVLAFICIGLLVLIYV